MTLKDLLTDITQLPWRPVVEGPSAVKVLASVRVPGRRGEKAKEFFVGSMNAAPDARYGCHAANVLPDAIQALRLLLAEQKRSKAELSRSQFEFCEGALARAERVQVEYDKTEKGATSTKRH